MRQAALVVSAVVLFAANLLSGCATSTPVATLDLAEAPGWRGRLALQWESSQVAPGSAASGFSAEFELTGGPGAGQLTFYTPLGGTAAALSWSPGAATLRTSQGVRQFESLDALVQQTIGTELPVAALFAWLAGEPSTMAGWSADLSQFAQGRISARRTEPGPAANLRLVLER